MCEDVECIARLLVNDGQPVDLVFHQHLHGIVETARGGREGGMGGGREGEWRREGEEDQGRDSSYAEVYIQL